MKFASLEVITFAADVITTSCTTDCPCFDPMTPGTDQCPYDE